MIGNFVEWITASWQGSAEERRKIQTSKLNSVTLGALRRQ